MDRLSAVVLRHRRVVIAVWLVLLVAGGAAAGALSGRLSFDFSLPGQPGYAADQRIEATYGVSPQDTLVAVVTVPAGQTVAQRGPEVAAVFEQVRAAAPQLRVVDYASSGDDAFVFDGGRATFALVQGPTRSGFTDQAQAAVSQAGAGTDLQVRVSSYSLLSQSGPSSGPSVLIETLIGALGALTVLVFVLASFLALVPLAVAAVSILTTFLLVLGLTYLTDVSFVVQFLISLIGLGVAIDYSLLLVSRWREERAHGLDNHQAVTRAMGTAGRAVVASGVTVAISLLALVVIPVPLLRSVGLGGMLIPLVSVAVVLTLLPAVLGSIGPPGRLATDPARGERLPRLEPVGALGRPATLGGHRGGPGPARGAHRPRGVAAHRPGRRRLPHHHRPRSRGAQRAARRWRRHRGAHPHRGPGPRRGRAGGRRGRLTGARRAHRRHRGSAHRGWA